MDIKQLLTRFPRIRKPHKENLRLEKESFDILVQAIEEYAIFTLDPNGLVKSWNAGAERFKGYKAHEVLGKHFSIFYPEQMIKTNFPNQELELAKKNGRCIDEGYRVRKDGTSFWAHVTITAIYGPNKTLTGFLKVTRDMTEKKQAEEALRHLNEELENRVKERTLTLYEREQELKAAKELAEGANEAKSSFLANMSHEIRTPLGAILGFSDLLFDNEVSEDERSMAKEAIKRNGQILTDLINDILDLSKVEANRLDIESIPVDLKQLALEIHGAFKLRAENKNIEFNLNMHPNTPARIRTDSLRVKQILFNVIGNAIKFTRKGHVSVDIYAKDSKLFFAVKDTGMGIASNQIQNLFAPFQQADPSITRSYGGTGLGLILSKRLAKALGGDLVLTESTINVGSTFTAYIHLQEENQQAENTILNNFEKERKILQDKKILIVDDSSDNRILISLYFKTMAVQLQSASDGIRGIEKALSWSPDLILMDLQMPLMGGVAATEELRKKDFKSPIIALTAHALKEEKERCLAMGFDAYITKPVDKNLLITTVAKFLNQSQLNRP